MKSSEKADFAPKGTGLPESKFRFWCQKVLPLVYDDSLSYYELLSKVIEYLNNTIADVATAETNISRLLSAYNSLQNYVNDETGGYYKVGFTTQNIVNSGVIEKEYISPAVEYLVGDVIVSIGTGRVGLVSEDIGQTQLRVSNVSDFHFSPSYYYDQYALPWKKAIARKNMDAEYSENIASKYNEAATYEAGEYCEHDGILYQCLNDIYTPEAFDSDNWVQVKITDVMGSVSSEVTPASVVTATSEMTAEQKTQTRENIGAGTPLTPQQIADGAGAWLEDNLATPSTPPIDSTLSVANAAADAKAVGDKVGELNVQVSDVYINNVYGSNSSDWDNYNLMKAVDKVVNRQSENRLTLKNRTPVDIYIKLNFTCPSGAKYRVFFFAESGALADNTYYDIIDAGLDDLSVWHTDNRSISVPEGAQAFAVTIAMTDNSDLTPAEKPNIVIKQTSLESRIEKLETDIEDKTSEEEVVTIVYNSVGSVIFTENATWQTGYVNPNGAGIQQSTTRCYTSEQHFVPSILPNENKYLNVICPSNMKSRVTFWNSDEMGSAYLVPTSSNSSWTEGSVMYFIPPTAKSYRVSIAFANDAAISTSDCESIELYNIIGKSESANPYKGKKISILGDSISTFAGNDVEQASDNHWIADGTYTYTGNHCRYPTAYLSSVDDTYWMKLINALEMNLGVNDSWAGSRVSWSGTEGDDFGADIYIASPTRIGHLGNNGTPDFILVNAGTNDIGLKRPVGTFYIDPEGTSPRDWTNEEIAALPVSTFADAYMAMLIRLQKTYPLAKVIVMLPNYTTAYYDPTNADKYLEVIKEECDYFGVPWVDMRTCGVTMYNTGTYLGDGIHPNVKGMSLLFDKLNKFFNYTL